MPLGGRYPDSIHSMVKAYATKGTLLSAQSLEGLTEARDLDDLVTRLKGTVYNESVSKLQRPYSARMLELAFREHLASLHYSLMQVTPRHELLAAYYLRYVASDLKTVLKGKALGKGYDELLQHLDLHAEELIGRRDLIVKALSAASLEAAVELLRDSEFGTDIEAAVQLFREKGDVQTFDTYLDRAVYRNLLGIWISLQRSERLRRWEREASMLQPMVAVDADGHNVLALLRAKVWELPQAEVKALLLEPTFGLRTPTLELMMESDSVREAIKYLQTTDYRRIVPAEGSDQQIISKLEEAFELLGYERAADPFLWDVFGPSVALGIVKLKQLEARNLSSIAFGVEESLGPQRIRSRLVAFRSR